MSRRTPSERRDLEDLIGKAVGFVLSFRNRGASEFVTRVVGKSIVEGFLRVPHPRLRHRPPHMWVVHGPCGRRAGFLGKEFGRSFHEFP